jgi:cell division protein FtsB
MNAGQHQADQQEPGKEKMGARRRRQLSGRVRLFIMLLFQLNFIFIV